MESTIQIQTQEDLDFFDAFSEDGEKSTKGSEGDVVPNGHDGVDWAKTTVAKALDGIIPPESISRIINGPKGDGKGVKGETLRVVANYLVGWEQSIGKEVKIPKIEPIIKNGLQMTDLPRSEYAKISVLMGLIVNCCAYPGGGGSQLVKAAQISEYYKIMIVKSQETDFINALTVVTCDKARQNLIILGLEVNTPPNKTYAHLLFNAAKQMVGQENFANAYLAIGGQTLHNMDLCGKRELSDALSKQSTKALEDFAKLSVLNASGNVKAQGAKSVVTISAKGQNDFELNQDPQIRFEKLSDLPEAGVLLRVAKHKAEALPMAVAGIGTGDLGRITTENLLQGPYFAKRPQSADGKKKIAKEINKINI